MGEEVVVELGALWAVDFRSSPIISGHLWG